VIVADLTQPARQALSDEWEKPFTALVASLDTYSGRRPPLVTVVEDAYALRIASRILRSHNARLSPRRPAPIEIGVYLEQSGTLGPASILPTDLPPVSFEPDIKDAALAPLRQKLLNLGKQLRQHGGPKAAEAASRALRFLRQTASLPIGLSEARQIMDILNAGDDEEDRVARSAFRAKMELAGLYGVADAFPALGREARQVAGEIGDKVDSWAEETPVSAKLTALLDAAGQRASGVMIAVGSKRARDVLLSSERALKWDCEVVAPDGLSDRLAAARPKRLIVVGPSPEIARILLTSPALPPTVALIGDVAGVGLLHAEIRPVSVLESFRPLAARADALRAALARGGGDEKLDLAEADFCVRATVPPGEVDFTRSGEDYRGDVVHISTTRGRYAYRPGSDVLVQSPSELRPFVKREARHIHVGDLILALETNVRDKLRRALCGARRVQDALAAYHHYIARLRPQLSGKTAAEKARGVVRDMQRLEPDVPDAEVHNVRRWITADSVECDADGYRTPGAARDWRRFALFAKAVGMPDVLATTYWQAAVVPTRAYRAQEGHGFNQRIVQFVLDPEATAIGAGAFARLSDLWQTVLTSVDEVVSVVVEHREAGGGHG
jgi:hypothetical protein